MAIKVKDALGKKLRDLNWEKSEYVEVLFVGSKRAFVRFSDSTEASISLEEDYDEFYEEPKAPQLPSERIFKAGKTFFHGALVHEPQTTTDIRDALFEITTILDEQAKEKRG